MNNGNKLKWIFRTHGNWKKIKILGAVLEINFGYFLEGHKIWKNLPLKIWRYLVASNLKLKIFFKFCGLLRISELYWSGLSTFIQILLNILCRIGCYFWWSYDYQNDTFTAILSLICPLQFSRWYEGNYGNTGCGVFKQGVQN